MMYLNVPPDIFGDLIDYFDRDNRFNTNAEQYIKYDSEVVLRLTETGTDDSLIIDTPGEGRVTIFLVNDMVATIQGMINNDRRDYQ